MKRCHRTMSVEKRGSLTYLFGLYRDAWGRPQTELLRVNPPDALLRRCSEAIISPIDLKQIIRRFDFDAEHLK